MTETLVPSAADLISRAGDSISPERARLIEEAYAFAENAHDGQSRKTGEPYIVHPIDAAMTVAELKLDGAAIAAALDGDAPELLEQLRALVLGDALAPVLDPDLDVLADVRMAPQERHDLVEGARHRHHRGA